MPFRHGMIRTKPNHMSYIRGDFSFMTEDHERRMVEDAFQAMEKVEGSWAYLSRPEVPEKDTGFMFSRDPIVRQISEEVDKNSQIGHSGSSYGWTMRQIEFIAKHGWDDYVKNCVKNQKKREDEEKARKAAIAEKEKPARYFNDPFFNEMRTIPHFNAQIEEAEKLAASQGGKLSYAQMRSIMG